MSPLAIGLLALVALACAALPAGLSLANSLVFRRAPESRDDGPPPRVSVLVPARNEAGVIERLIHAVLGSRGVDLELVILDDDSADGTGAIVERLAAHDARVRLVRGGPLPAGWCGKQHACWQLARAAAHETWIFLDVDVVPCPDAIRRSVAFLDASGAALVSGFPRQVTGSLLEWLLLPLIQFVLLGFLPIARSRKDRSPGLAAGCGQWFVTRRADYERAGGHAAIRASLHDGIMLPRTYRRAGLATDIFDASDIVSCRMYARGVDVWRGLAKNATEGIGAPATILPFTFLLGAGQILPSVLVAAGLATGWRGWPAWGVAASGLACCLAFVPRVVEAIWFRQSLTSALVQPLAITVFLAIQWYALARKALGLNTTWRGRSLTPQ